MLLNTSPVPTKSNNKQYNSMIYIICMLSQTVTQYSSTALQLTPPFSSNFSPIPHTQGAFEVWTVHTFDSDDDLRNKRWDSNFGILQYMACNTHFGCRIIFSGNFSSDVINFVASLTSMRKKMRKFLNSKYVILYVHWARGLTKH